MGHEIRFILPILLLSACGSNPVKPTLVTPKADLGACKVSIGYPNGASASGEMKYVNEKLLGEVWTRAQADGSQMVERVEYTWTGDKLTHTSRTIEGKPAETITYSYADGAVSKVERDYWDQGLPGADGTADEVTTFERQPTTERELIDRVGPNAGLDGNPDVIIERSLENGLVREETTQHDGRLVEVTKFKYQDGRAVEKQVYVDPDLPPESVTKFDYDDQGRLVREIETSALGETVTNYTYCD